MRGGGAVVPVIVASRYWGVGVLVNIGALAVELGGGVLLRGYDRVGMAWNEGNWGGLEG